MIRIMVQLSEEQKIALEQLAKLRKVSVARLVRESVAEYILKASFVPDADEKRRRALAVIESIEAHPENFCDPEGKVDVAERHDDYLTEIYGQ